MVDVLIVLEDIDVDFGVELMIIDWLMGIMVEESWIVDFSMVDFDTDIANTWEETVLMNLCLTHKAVFIN